LVTSKFVARKASDEDSNVDLSEMILETSEPSKELER
jgi:hypothetical protein